MTGKTIRIYLVDGVPSGILTAEIINWTGKIFVAPRNQLGELAQRDEVKRTGIYCMVGPDPDEPGRDRVYVGEGDNVIKRLIQHDKDPEKDFFTRAIVIISKDDNITKSHGRYLESRVISMAHAAGRAFVVNGTAPATNPLPEPDVADMQYFLGQLGMVLPVLGFNFLQPKPNYVTVGGIVKAATVQSPAADSPRFVMNEGDKQAFAIEADGEFVVLKGSPARKQSSPTWTSYRKQREALIAAGMIISSDDPDYYVFAEDVPLSSPSAGAAMIAAGNRNGRTYWKVEATGETYADWHEAKMNSDVEE